MPDWSSPSRSRTAFFRARWTNDAELVPTLTGALLLGRAAAFLRIDTAFLGTRGRTRLLADLGLDHGRANQRREALLRRAAIALLGAFAHGFEQYAAVVDEPLAGEATQTISDGHRQTDVLRQQEPQLRGARHLVDVLRP